MMGMGDYGSGRFTASTGSTTTVTSGSNPSGGGSSSGVRRVRLARPPASSAAPCIPPTFGFSVRGGREHSTGFFVSHVEPASEAYNQGLKVGDQVVRVNGFRVSDALHKELLSLISGLNYLKLKVRNVGMIPVKDKPNDSLTWRMIPDSMLFSDSSQRSSPTILNSHKEGKIKDVRLTLYVPSRSKLGCGICKGPDWKPGIFVQFTKENGIARESGLRPGDQIMQCNGIDFRDIQFSDAVALMKQAKRLDLWVRTGAGLDLFPGESSGYNSSASSATGDQSPSSSDHKRLSIVKEETLELEDRLNQLDSSRYKRKNWDHRNFEWERENSIKECDSEFGKEYYDTQMNNCAHQSIYSNYEKDKVLPQNRTIINLSENGTTIQTNYVLPSTNDNSIYSDVCPVNAVQDKKTIVVDVHRSEIELKDRVHDNVTNIECKSEEIHTPLKKVPSNSSIVSLANSTASSSLSNAISQELLKRSQRRKDNGNSIAEFEEMRKNKVLKDVDDEKKQKHNALMDEFKRAHRKMFANSMNGVDSKSETNTVDNKVDKSPNVPMNPLNPLSKMVTEQEDEKYNSTAVLGDRPLNAYSRTSTIQQDSITTNNNNVANKINGISSEVLKRNFKPPDQPPPPPPMPGMHKNGVTNGKTENNNNKIVATHTKPKAPPPPPLKKPMQNGNHINHLAEMSQERPPSTPTPDYDTTLIKVTNKTPIQPKPKTDIVEMESMESFKMNTPVGPEPKPPSTYFMKQQNGTLTMKKASQPISVTIGEYPSNTFRKQPSKLDFLNGSDTVDNNFKSNEPVGSRLQSELTQKLSRSNLKKKTEALDYHLTNGSKQIDNPFDTAQNDQNGEEPNANFHKRYGHVMLPQPPTINIPKIPIGKSLSHSSTLNGNEGNKITINTHHVPNGKQELMKTESLPQNGILKNSTPVFIKAPPPPPVKIGMQHKSIKFGQTTTVIGEPDLPLYVNH